MRVFLCAVLLMSCSRTEPSDGKLNTATKEKLKERAELYCELSKPFYEENLGNVEEAGRCDGALFTSLHSTLCGYVTVTQFESKTEPGKLCRDAECRCYYGDWGTKSGWSKDMAVGMQLALALKPDTELANRHVKYGEANFWVVCDAATETDKLGRCLMSTSIIDRWARLAGLALQEGESEDAIGLNTGYQAHLDIVGMLRDRLIMGGVSKLQKYILKEQAKRVPQNLLFRALNSRYHAPHDAEAVGQSLLKMFPEDRLPDTSDWCEPYLWQRDPGDDWEPCDSTHTHRGTDFITAVYALTE